MSWLHRTVRSRAWSAALLMAALAAMFALSGGVEARALDDKEKAALKTTIDDFQTALKRSDMPRVVDTIPPKILAAIGKDNKLDANKVREATIEAMTAVMKENKIESFSIDFDKAEYRELKSGEPYALLPTTTVVALGGDKGRVQQKTHTLAMMDEGKWYLISIGDTPQLLMLRDVYPDFSGVEFPNGSMEVLKK